MELWRPKMPSSHTKPSGGAILTPCEGVFQWGKTSFQMAKAEIRRECPVCGCRQAWNKRGQAWHSVEPNSHPGTGNWVDGS